VLVSALAATTLVGVALVMLAPQGALPYSKASFTAADVKRAFAREGIDLSVRSRSVLMTTLGNPGDILEVDVFGDRKAVERSGFHDVTIANGRPVPFARDCSSSVPAERWHGNIRVLVDCTRARTAGQAWLLRVERAFNRF
jgi:hypothetical protein